MPLTARDVEIAAEDHVVQFYGDDAELVAGVAPYLAAAAHAGETAIVIATDRHRSVFQAALAAEGVDVERATSRGQLLWCDAAETLARIVDHDGAVDALAFHEVIGGLVREALRSGKRLRAYGEMVALLWHAGDVLGAIELERLWNELAQESPFALFCSYHADAVSGPAHADALHSICGHHSVILGRPHGSDAAARTSSLSLDANFAAGPGAPGRARRLVVGELRRWGLPDDTIDDAALIVSELASNAVRHARSAFTISVLRADQTLRLAVADACDPAVARAAGGMTPQARHGLGVIDTIASDWGLEAAGGGKIVWATLAL